MAVAHLVLGRQVFKAQTSLLLASCFLTGALRLRASQEEVCLRNNTREAQNEHNLPLTRSVRLQVRGLGHQSSQNNTELQRTACCCCCCCLGTQPCLTLCDPVDCSPPGSSVLEISQAKILECIAIPSPSRICSTQG